MKRLLTLLCPLALAGALVGCVTTPAPLPGEAPAAAAPGPAEPHTYTVRPGDTLNAIAFRFEMDVRELVRLNDIRNPDAIYAGQILRLGEGAGAVAMPPVKAGPVPRPNVESPAPMVSAKPKPLPIVGVESRPDSPAGGENFDDKKQVTKWSWPVNGRVVGTFSTGGQGNKGINIAGTMGEPVLAAADGRVLYSGSGVRGYGQLIIIKHSNEFMSAYAHNSRLYVQENQVVKVGQRIADMGNSGTDTTQLHFEIRYREKPVDPLKYLPRR